MVYPDGVGKALQAGRIHSPTTTMNPTETKPTPLTDDFENHNFPSGEEEFSGMDIDRCLDFARSLETKLRESESREVGLREAGEFIIEHELLGEGSGVETFKQIISQPSPNSVLEELERLRGKVATLEGTVRHFEFQAKIRKDDCDAATTAKTEALEEIARLKGEVVKLHTARYDAEVQRNTALAQVDAAWENRNRFCKEINVIGHGVLGWKTDNCAPDAVSREVKQLVAGLQKRVEAMTKALEQCVNSPFGETKQVHERWVAAIKVARSALAPPNAASGKLCCRLCGKTAQEIGGYLHRVNEKGVDGIWECRPSCDSKMDDDARLLAALEHDEAPPAATEEGTRA